QIRQRRTGLCHPVPACRRHADDADALVRGGAGLHPVLAVVLLFFTVLGVIKLRITSPDLPRPYRTWGYPVTPLVFLLVTGFMMYYLLTERPLQALLGMLIMMSGLLIYAIFHRR